MTAMLASVSNLDEATLVLAEDVDIIDLKEPASGALGALPVDLVRQIVLSVNGRCPVSATIGDMPMYPEPVLNAVKEMAETGVDYIKIGFFPDGDWQRTVAYLSSLTHQKIALIAVLFADQTPDFSVIDTLKKAGFKGVMLDTQQKKNGSLTQILNKKAIAEFVQQAKNRQLICGLAGSLRLQDIPELLSHQPDYLGFRGALCVDQERTSALSRQAIAQIKQAINAECPLLAT